MQYSYHRVMILAIGVFIFAGIMPLPTSASPLLQLTSETLTDQVSKKHVPVVQAVDFINNMISTTRETIRQPFFWEDAPRRRGNRARYFAALPGEFAPPAVPFLNVLERTTPATRVAVPDSPFYRTNWLTYYGRPNVPVMGILGEHDIDSLTILLYKQALEYDNANGPHMGVTPAFHIVYGMATRAAGADGSHLVFLKDETVMAYIERAAEEGFAVILDIQVGALSPVDAMRPAFEFLRFPHVHLAIDPEFAMVRPYQTVPGSPIGFLTGQQINNVQMAMQAYLDEHDLVGPRVLLVHQFLDEMIVNKQDLEWSYPIDLAISVDGWGGPAEKILKYNLFVDDSVEFSAFKLFYQWDEPLLNEAQALGLQSYGEIGMLDVVPNLVIYQ